MLKNLMTIFLITFLLNCASDSALINRIKEEKQKEALDIINNETEEWNKKGKFGFTPLHYASEYGNIELVKILVSKGANVNEKTGTFYESGAKEGYLTPLHLAIKYGHLDVASFLISKGADINAQTYRKFTILTIIWNKALFESNKEKLVKEIEFVSALNTRLDYPNNSIAYEIINYYPKNFKTMNLFENYINNNLYINCCNRKKAPMLGFSNLNSPETIERKISLEILKLILKKDIDLTIQHHKSGMSNRDAFQRIFTYSSSEAKEAQKLILGKYPNILDSENGLISGSREMYYFLSDVLFNWWFNILF